MTATDDDAGMSTSDRTGLLIVRLWIEGNPVDGFRARITQKLDSTTVEHAVAVADNAQDVSIVVQKWMVDFVNSN